MSRKHRNLIFSIAALGSACISTVPAWADDPQTTSVQAPTNVQAKSAASHITALPRAIAGFCAGVVVGTPICFARKFPQEVKNGAHGFIGSIGSTEDSKLLFIPACVAWVPVALVITSVEAPGYAVKDAYTAEKAFSKEQFSLGELDQ